MRLHSILLVCFWFNSRRLDRCLLCVCGFYLKVILLAPALVHFPRLIYLVEYQICFINNLNLILKQFISISSYEKESVQKSSFNIYSSDRAVMVIMTFVLLIVSIEMGNILAAV
ncbi:hypothetical protein BDQ17DRAFT_1358413 [Cyathus striatus]|nr:hypothetical protein BDQ17DRAFT_1358413 [Cyathus striatus]